MYLVQLITHFLPQGLCMIELIYRKAETPAKCKSHWKTQNTYLVPSKHHGILRLDVQSDNDTGFITVMSNL